MKFTRDTVALILLAGILCGCGNGEKKEEENKSALYTESNSGVASSSGGGYVSNEPEGPQYQTPSVEQLKGKPQLFPARYPIRRYPGSKVAMVDVRPNRRPGYKNMVMLSTADTMPRISGFYKQQLATEEWQKIKEYRNSIYESSTWVKGDLVCEVRIAPDLTSPSPDKKFVQLFYGKRPPKLAGVK